jgi:hypothetical protein
MIKAKYVYERIITSVFMKIGNYRTGYIIDAVRDIFIVLDL